MAHKIKLNYDGWRVVKTANSQYKYMNKQGEQLCILGNEPDEISNTFTVACEFQDGWALVAVSFDEWNFINNHGELFSDEWMSIDGIRNKFYDYMEQQGYAIENRPEFTTI